MARTFLTKTEKWNVYREFETSMASKTFQFCQCCRRVKLSLRVTKCEQRCSNCYSKEKDFYLNRNSLPIWKDNNGVPQFYVPDCLKSLTIGEKLIIQRASPLIPLKHIKDGVNGLRGHVCAFPSDVNGWVTTLPRLPSDVTVLKVVRQIQTEIGGKETKNKIYNVRRNKVLEALIWLKQYNIEYSDIQIEESQLNWINGEEGDLKGIIDIHEVLQEDKKSPNINDDLGPAIDQTSKPTDKYDEINAIGVIIDDTPPQLSQDDMLIQEALRQAKKVANNHGHKTCRIDLPTVTPEPLNEYDYGTKIFCLAFPWLFPGGIGDFVDYPTDEATKWGEMLLNYEDARFLKDDLFCFFAMNYITRRSNNGQGKYFLDTLWKGVSTSLPELQQRIKEGESDFVNSISYHAHRIKGSNPYWIQKRSELYSWINHHVEKGNGPPVFFITLTCAEYYWPDIIRLIKDRMILAGDNPDDLDPNKPRYIQIINDYSLVVQEYFQEKVITWLESVGKRLMGIEHYWIRYEFTPGRGQIHAHLLATSSDRYIYPMMARAWRDDRTGKKRAQKLSDWASKRFGLSATVMEDFDSLPSKAKDSPVTIRFYDIENIDENKNRDDIERLKRACQYHICNGFCMRDPRKG